MDLVHTLPSKLATSLLQVVILQLASPAIKEVAKIWRVDKELGGLQATYEKIKVLLGNWDHSWQNDGTSLETWLQELEGYFYDTEDLVDLLILSCPTNGENGESGQHPIRRQILTSFLKRWKTPHKIGELRANMERVHDMIQGVLNNSIHPCPTATPVTCYTSLLSDNTPLVSGTSRDQDKQAIIRELTSSQNHSYGVSIVGMDGLGKTALARTILVDETITSHFRVILSASVSGCNGRYSQEVTCKPFKFKKAFNS